MKEKIEQYLLEIEQVLTNTADEAEQFRIRYLGRKGVLNDLFEDFKSVPNEHKKLLGQELNRLKNAVQEKLNSLQETQSVKGKNNSLEQDLSRPTGHIVPGTHHPLSIVRREILDIFSRIGFTVADGPEIEDDWHVFSGLNTTSGLMPVQAIKSSTTLPWTSVSRKSRPA